NRDVHWQCHKQQCGHADRGDRWHVSHGAGRKSSGHRTIHRCSRQSGRVRGGDRRFGASCHHLGARSANRQQRIRRHHLDPDERLRRLVLLLDVSGSMEPYSRAMLRFMHAALVGRQRVEAFAFGTRLTRLTKDLSERDPDRALTRASSQVPDWSGGTRLGESLRTFNDTWGVRGMARGSIVVIVSDGWDRGDPSVLAEQMSRLSRVAFRTIWVNPLKVTPGYAPLARGMAAALPYVDEFVEGHSLAALERLADVISAD
ncbi:MAG: VWA domain-containing protein, partial [Actinobacteria bacterium]|nr:VWA domain-containing protein [Actinomycetota bacterium]